MQRAEKIKEPKRFKRFMKMKLMFVFLLITGVMCVLIGRLVYLNNTDGERYKKSVLLQQTTVSSTLPYQRGSILDRNKSVLAISKKVYNVILDPKVLLTDKNNVETTLDAIVQVFPELKKEDMKKLLDEKPDNSYTVLLKKQEYDRKAQFEQLKSESKKIKGVWFEEEYERTYPYGALASHVIGYTSAGDVGTWGIEQYYNTMLNGTNGRIYGYYDPQLNLESKVKEPTNGLTIVSTIDLYVQQLVEQHIERYMNEIGANNIGVIVANPNNGEIYAMASNNGFDLNDPFDLTSYYSDVEIASMEEKDKLTALNKIWRNFCISDTYEPGSTFKPITVAAGLEENLVTPESTFLCNGYKMVADRRIRCNATHGTVTLAQALMKSCNPALMAIGDALGREKFREYQDRFGLGKKTGIDLPGEATGILMDVDKLNITELATSSFGQTSNVTMVQMVAAFSSLINGGHYYQPRVVKEIINDKGVVVDSKKPVILNETVSAKTSEFLREALFLTVDQGTAKPAKVQGYLVGGKTGTAQKFPRDAKKYVVSFIGCVPADDPQIVIYVVMDEIHDEEKKASSTQATTLTSQILKDILPALGVYPKEGEIVYRVELPQVEEKPMVDENGNPISSEVEPFTDSDAEAIPADMSENMPIQTQTEDNANDN